MSESKSMAPATLEKRAGPVKSESLWQPLAALRSEIDRLFDDAWYGLGAGKKAPAGVGRPAALWPFAAPAGSATPAIDLVEAEGEYRITAEMPGLDAKDVELSLTGDMLVISGEKKEEREEKAESYYLSERRYGGFERFIKLPGGVDRDRVDASFDKGVLTLRLPKLMAAAAQQKKIEIKQGS